MPNPILVDSISVELGAQEPWPQPISLYQPYEVEQILLPDNANCLAVQALLKMCDLNFEIEPRWNSEYMSPANKIPLLKCGQFVVSDYDNIVAFLGNRGINLSERLSTEDKVNLRAYVSLINKVLYNAELYICWCDENTYNNVTKVRHGSVYPWPLNHLMNWQKRSQVKKRLSALGWANKSLEEIYDDVKKCCEALSERLDNKLYFFGDKPTELDALVFGHIFSIITTPLQDDALANIIRQYTSLVTLTKQIENSIFSPRSDLF